MPPKFEKNLSVEDTACLTESVRQIIAKEAGLAVEVVVDEAELRGKLANQLDLNSLNRVNVILELEKYFDIYIEDVDFENILTVKNVIDLVIKTVEHVPTVDETVMRLVREFLNLHQDAPDPDPTLPFDDNGLDSLDSVELEMAIEEEYDIVIDDDAMKKHKTINDVIATTKELLSQKEPVSK